MGVEIDDARRDDAPLDVEGRAGRPADRTDLDDGAVLDRDVGAVAGKAGAIDDHAVLDDQVVRHVLPSASPALAGYRL